MAVKEAAPRIGQISHPSVDERLGMATAARDRTPPSSHAGWRPAADRPDPVGLLKEQDRTREPDLVPVRHSRMMVSPFTFCRGAATIMAADLAGGQWFEIVDAARKVVGVASVGTRAFIVLLAGRDAHDPLLLQIKEATASVLEGYLPGSRYRQHGERVVQGQRMMQAVSDIFLGWTEGLDTSRHFYWRQLRDMKGSALVELMAPVTLAYYARICGWTLARAHARSGDPVAMACYLGRDDAFDRSITDFCERYADQNEQDHEEFVTAIRSGRLEAVEGV